MGYESREIIIKVTGKFYDEWTEGYITEDEHLIWIYGGVRSIVGYGFGPERLLLGQPLANLKYDPQPLIKRYGRSCNAVVRINNGMINNILVDENNILEYLLR